MPWPPSLPPTGRADLTPQLTDHPDDHNRIAGALAEVVTRDGYGVRCHRPNNTFSIASGSPVGILPSVETFRRGFAASGTRYQFQGAEAQAFLVIAGASWDVNATGVRRLIITYNGVTAGVDARAGIAGWALNHQCIWTGYLQPGDEIGIELYQNTGAALDLISGSQTFLTAAPAWSG